MHSRGYFALAECRTIFAFFSDIIAFFMARLPKIQVILAFALVTLLYLVSVELFVFALPRSDN